MFVSSDCAVHVLTPSEIVVQDVLDKIPQDQRTKVIEIFSNKGPARTVETIRPALLKLQLPRSLVDELEVLGNTCSSAQ